MLKKNEVRNLVAFINQVNAAVSNKCTDLYITISNIQIDADCELFELALCKLYALEQIIVTNPQYKEDLTWIKEFEHDYESIINASNKK